MLSALPPKADIAEAIIMSAKFHVWGRSAYGFLDNHGVYTTIDPPGSHLPEPISINAKGQIVGVYRELGEPGDDPT